MKIYEKEVYGVTTNGVRVSFGYMKATATEMVDWLQTIPTAQWASVNTHLFFPQKYASVAVEPFTPEEIEELKAAGEYP